MMQRQSGGTAGVREDLWRLVGKERAGSRPLPTFPPGARLQGCGGGGGVVVTSIYLCPGMNRQRIC